MVNKSNTDERTLLNEMIGQALLDIALAAGLLKRETRAKIMKEWGLSLSTLSRMQQAPDFSDLQSFASHLMQTVY